MGNDVDLRRRRFVGTAGLWCLLPVAPAFADERPQGKGTKAAAESPVPPTEDLMREHGVLRRILFIWEAGGRRIGQGEDIDARVFIQTAQAMRDFIHDYHEKLEEEHLFPIFKKAGRMVQLVDTLLRQHAAGRKLTERILHLAPTARSNSDQRGAMVEAMQASILLYRPHAAREDTDLFPTLRHLVTPNQFDALGETFEKEENSKFGSDGFEKVTKAIEQVEKKIGIHDLNQFTPRT